MDKVINMNRKEHLLTILAEECAEVAQRATKALRFGLEEVQPGQDLTNEKRIRLEMEDLLGVYEMLVYEGHLEVPDQRSINAKKVRIELYFDRSRSNGSLND